MGTEKFVTQISSPYISKLLNQLPLEHYIKADEKASLKYWQTVSYDVIEHK